MLKPVVALSPRDVTLAQRLIPLIEATVPSLCVPPRVRRSVITMAPEPESLAPTLRENEFLFGVCHLFASFNDTFIHVTDLSGRETLVRRTGGMEVKADRDESSPYAAMMAAQKVAERLKDLGVSAIHIKLRATGGNTTKTPGPGMSCSLP